MASNDRRILFVHAHPDDETIASGATMAKYVEAGAHVALVTCTLGEEGEVLVPSLEHMAAAHQDTLGGHRQVELAEALKVLGVTDHEYLGGAGRYRDSGMMGLATNDRPNCFWQADLLEAATPLVATIRRVRPQVVVTYNEFGQYGHPDHIQTHRVTSYALGLAEAAPFKPELGAAWSVAKVYWTALPKSAVERGIEAFIEAGGQGFFGLSQGEDLPWAVDDALLTAKVEALEQEPRKMAALRAHLSQVGEENDFFRVSELVGPEAMGIEYFQLARGVPGPRGADGLEDDLFAGL
ncbi:MAG TPA: N-acetyl-1-D-myo-inositol-2-amino-2-deoxy-alpha-D-glucopyranoside deacetylase [Actinomycetes bacterium]|nr:N-acetyl-1-D-myo-inositol-2-amino-2-deoxy-alpha-D-glucopyranoside deacetylase [Actinomycetes bacterium]